MELPYWLKVTFLPKILRILTTRGEKDNFTRLRLVYIRVKAKATSPQMGS